jgi:hypothetical protein
VALIHHRVYNSILVNPVPTPSVVTSWGAVLLQHHTPTATGLATLLRTRSELQFTAAVGAPGLGIPPEVWWAQCSVTLSAWWVPTGSLTLLPLSGSTSQYLGSQLLQKRLVASPSSPSEYYVEFFTDDPLVTETSRKPVGAHTSATVNFQLGVTDPQFALTGGFGGITQSAFLRAFSLWGDTV